MELRKNDIFYLINESLNSIVKESNKKITLKLKNILIELQNSTILPVFYYNYNVEKEKYTLKVYKIELNNVDKISE